MAYPLQRSRRYTTKGPLIEVGERRVWRINEDRARGKLCVCSSKNGLIQDYLEWRIVMDVREAVSNVDRRLLMFENIYCLVFLLYV